jgi:hypothetical protein
VSLTVIRWIAQVEDILATASVILVAMGEQKGIHEWGVGIILLDYTQEMIMHVVTRVILIARIATDVTIYEDIGVIR